jgi:nucleoside-diphosphate-sugar epimerase
VIDSRRATPLGKQIVVTGAAGFIGSHLVDALTERGCQVVGVDRRSLTDDPFAAMNLAVAAENPQVRMVHTDLADADLAEVVAGADTVFHLAAVPGVRTSWGDRFPDYVRSNITATQRLLTACEQQGVRRLVIASSSSVYGTSSGPSREQDPTGPLSPYGVTKLAAEQLCLAHARRADTALSVVALRYFTVYGPRQRPGMAINQLLLSALTGAVIPLYGDGRQRREFTYVSDVVTATLAAAEAGVMAAVVNVGGGTSITMRQAIQLAEEVTGRPVAVAELDDQAGDVRATEADLTLAGRVLGYRPAVELHDGMAAQAAWLATLTDAQRHSLLRDQLAVTR